MAMLASKSQYVAPMGNSAPTPSSHYPSSSASHRHPATSNGAHHGTRFASPTESEFSESYDTPDSVRYGIQDAASGAWNSRLTGSRRNWDEDRVGEWLKSINCAHYVPLFRGQSKLVPGDALTC